MTEALANALTAAVSVKLPLFWPQDADIWFLQAESQFATRNITVDDTKYHHVVQALDQATARRVRDFISHPPADNKYRELKALLVSTFGLTRQQRYTQLLELDGLGDGGPAAMMDKMLALLGDEAQDTKTHILFEGLFMRLLPEQVRSQMANETFADPRAFARKADKIWAAAVSTGTLFAATMKPSSSSAKTSKKDDGLCYFHHRFGDKAQKCRPPCKQAGNVLADPQ